MNPIQALILELSNPKLIYTPGQEAPTHRPPTALELRAAKALYNAYKEKLPPVDQLNDHDQNQTETQP